MEKNPALFKLRLKISRGFNSGQFLFLVVIIKFFFFFWGGGSWRKKEEDSVTNPGHYIACKENALRLKGKIKVNCRIVLKFNKSHS